MITNAMTNVKEIAMKWWEKLREVREKNGLSQTELANKIGIAESSISRYESGKGAKNITRQLRESLKKAFSESEIRYISGELDNVVREPGVEYLSIGAIRIPVLSETASAGGGSNVEGVDSYEVGRSLSVDRELFGGADLAKVRAVRVSGYSMVPVLLPDSWVFFEEGVEWSGDGLYVLVFRGVLMVKQVEADPKSGNLWIKSANPDYDSWEYDPTEDQSTMRIVGRVVRVMM